MVVVIMVMFRLVELRIEIFSVCLLESVCLPEVKQSADQVNEFVRRALFRRCALLPAEPENACRIVCLLRAFCDQPL
ncbi:MAG: hypothetical protein E7J63_13490 [Pantoea sp.]|uniref:hypothetical protein n=2 Tax=Erwiniaceae TaxID=1903409 RepID=UPI00289A3BCC|nr:MULTISPECIES: hypothetical protein [Pantoea]MDU5473602.1 hypothetical protein [Pantoea sp.]MDU7839307.1 hypothetical protein [Pantoea sp.]